LVPGTPVAPSGLPIRDTTKFLRAFSTGYTHSPNPDTLIFTSQKKWKMKRRNNNLSISDVYVLGLSTLVRNCMTGIASNSGYGSVDFERFIDASTRNVTLFRSNAIGLDYRKSSHTW
jgi:hypothetical protein